ncbi:MAG TPA: hypothetical protein ENJ68_06165 [Devosia sp.]|nr:hypothetical protein [Devosia sp.]
MRPDIKNAVAGGAAGTIVLTLMMMFVAPLMTGQPMDIAAMLGTMVGGYTMGMLAHIMMGVIVFPLLYVFILYERLPGTPLIRGLIWGIILWVLAATMVMPMAGGGFLMSNLGGAMALLASLMGHLVYGGLLGAIAGDGARSAAAA